MHGNKKEALSSSPIYSMLHIYRTVSSNFIFYNRDTRRARSGSSWKLWRYSDVFYGQTLVCTRGFYQWAES